MCKVISVSLPKGGVGKTTTAVNLAASLAVLEKKVLLIDCDAANVCASSLGFEFENLKGGIFDVLTGSRKINEVLVDTELEYLKFIPADNNLSESEDKLGQVIHNVKKLKDVIAPLKNQYEYIIIDTPPYLKGINMLVMIASDSVIIPVKTANFSIIALKRMYENLRKIKQNYNSALTIEGVLLTMYERHTNAAVITEERLLPIFGKYVFKNYIPKTTGIAESTYYGKPIVLYNASSIGAVSYLKLTNEVLVRNRECPAITLEKNSLVESVPEQHPNLFYLKPNDPNPFKDFTAINFGIPERGRVKLRIFNLFMEEVTTLVDRDLDQGEYSVKWIPKGINSGVFYYRVDFGNSQKMNKLIYTK